MILYEYPFNERIRTWLRLERLFDRFTQLQQRDEAIDSHFALVTLFEILDVVSRPDLKSEIMRDLDRQKQRLQSYQGNPAIDEAPLMQTLDSVQNCFIQLEQMEGKIGHALTDNEWLTAIRSRVSIPGGTCEFDLPAYHAWQHRPAPNRQADLQGWMAHLQPLGNSIKLLLMLLRSTGQPKKMTAQGGQFQQNLPQNRTFQLLRLHMDPETALVPEISANRLIVTVRMMQQDEQGHLATSQQSVDFQLTLCS
ncbi:MAG: cell division protein ZapD [Brachymonas sp.]|nr:cell division protein ZapD [Brachymonas sp.]